MGRKIILYNAKNVSVDAELISIAAILERHQLEKTDIFLANIALIPSPLIRSWED